MPRSQTLAFPEDKEGELRKFIMMMALILLTIWAVLLLAQGEARAEAPGPGGKQGKENTEKTAVSDNLVMIWTSRDPDVARNMVFMYAKNGKLKSYWGQVRLVVWGPSAQLLATDQELQKELAQLQAAGVKVLACRACADRYGVTDKLQSLSIEVIFMGKPLTEMLKTGWTCLTF
jgi:hypothetical protein